MHCQFIPPYLLRRLTAVADESKAGEYGAATLRIDRLLRERRDTAPPVPRTTVAPDSGKRVIHTAGNTEDLPGQVVRRDADPPTGDQTVDEAHASAGQVWDLFADKFDRASVDGSGNAVSVTVHFGQDYDNAFWDGSQLVFGDGDGVVFDRFTKPMDVMAHEFTHGVTQFTAALAYQGQSGALNESVSDAFAAMAKQLALGQTADQADWLIGEGIFLPGINAKALRSMTDPGTAYDDPQLGRDPQVGSMADYVETSEDNGGVHINSGIPNRAFALTSLKIGGHSWEAPGRIWYDALTGGEVTADADFSAFARATVDSATRLFPDDASVADQVRAAWSEVGVTTDAPAPAADPVPELSPTPSGPAAPAGGRVAVRRSGGVSGVMRVGELDLDADPLGPEVRSLLNQVNLYELDVSRPSPDRFVYTLEVGELQVTLPEQDLTPELHRVVQLVLGDRPPGRRDLGAPRDLGVPGIDLG